MKNSYRLQLVFAAIISIIIGLVFILFPADSLTFINYIIVVTLIIIGLFQFIGYFVTSVQDNQFRIGFVLGLMSFMLAAYAYFEADSIIDLIPRILGILIIIDSAITLQNAIDLLRLGSRRWWYQLVQATVTIVLGALMFFNPFTDYETFMMFAGVTMIVNGVLDLSNIFYLSLRISRASAIEADYDEEEEDEEEEPEEVKPTRFRPIEADDNDMPSEKVTSVPEGAVETEKIIDNSVNDITEDLEDTDQI